MNQRTEPRQSLSATGCGRREHKRRRCVSSLPPKCLTTHIHTSTYRLAQNAKPNKRQCLPLDTLKKALSENGKPESSSGSQNPFVKLIRLTRVDTFWSSSNGQGDQRQRRQTAPRIKIYPETASAPTSGSRTEVLQGAY